MSLDCGKQIRKVSKLLDFLTGKNIPYNLALGKYAGSGEVNMLIFLKIVNYSQSNCGVLRFYSRFSSSKDVHIPHVLRISGVCDDRRYFWAFQLIVLDLGVFEMIGEEAISSELHKYLLSETVICNLVDEFQTLL